MSAFALGWDHPAFYMLEMGACVVGSLSIAACMSTSDELTKIYLIKDETYLVMNLRHSQYAPVVTQLSGLSYSCPEKISL